MLAVLGAQFLSGQLFRGGQGVNSADFHIWFHAFSFPVTFRYRVDRSAERDPNREVISGGHTSHGMGAATRRFAHDGAALLRLQIEGKFLPSRKGFVRSEYVDGLIDKAWSRNPGKCPVLVGLVVVAVGEIVDMGRLPEQIGNHKVDHTGIAAMIFAQVKDQGIGMRHKVHCGHDRRSADVRVRKRAELDVANVVIEDLNLGESAVVIFQHGPEPCFISRARLAWLTIGQFHDVIAVKQRVQSAYSRLANENGSVYAKELFRIECVF
jgi:hypothetical protein